MLVDFHCMNKAKQSKAKQSKAKQSKAKQSKAKQNKTKQNKTKQNKTKQNKTKQNKTVRHFSKYFIFCSTEERKPYRWKIPLTPETLSSILCFYYCTSTKRNLKGKKPGIFKTKLELHWHLEINHKRLLLVMGWNKGQQSLCSLIWESFHALYISFALISSHSLQYSLSERMPLISHHKCLLSCWIFGFSVEPGVRAEFLKDRLSISMGSDVPQHIVSHS